jgi:hypothetical protein
METTTQPPSNDENNCRLFREYFKYFEYNRNKVFNTSFHNFETINPWTYKMRKISKQILH